ncbi:hypothetical protein KGG77_gp30 [Streptomyces phage Omar]|uniref:Uncharacterized protein n=1 Tax=Streptomyces phage Omar TaxID=2059882 RepID=A0A2H5BLM4_9CAUD|nr:hypothetical protein KGG77_gp30 [Streptomyces phage Omar]AUG87238.1 hypothetical protein SEA_OMAR_54 [Streptomyces phage Omar]
MEILGLTCRYMTSKLVDTGRGEQWVYGYICGKPSIDRRTSACEDHLEPRYSPFPTLSRRVP